MKEADGVDLNDGAVRIFLNTHGKDDKGISQDLKELLYLIEHTNDQNKVFQSEKVNRIRQSVRAIQNNEEVSLRYMQEWEEKLMFKREGREEGRKEGRKEGREETRKELQPKIDEAERRQKEAESRLSEAEAEKNRIEHEAHEREVQIFLNLLNSGLPQEKVQSYTNSGENIVKEALERFRAE